MTEVTRTVSTADGDMGAVVIRPEGGGPFPVIVFFHHGPGLDEGSKEAMRRIAAAGYYVVSHDRYHRHGDFIVVNPAELRAAGPDSEAVRSFRAMLMGTTEDMVASDVTGLLADLAADPAARDAPMGCIGYCIGARSVIRTLADHSSFTAGVALHPSLCSTDAPDSPHTMVPGIAGSLYVGFGAEDQMQPVAQNEPLIAAVAQLGDRGTVEIHEGADHGFAVPGPAYCEPAADRSYEQALALFGNVVA